MNDRRTLIVALVAFAAVCVYSFSDRIWPPDSNGDSIHREQDEYLLPPKPPGTPFVGEVEWVSDIWTKNGDGWITVIRTCATTSGGIHKVRVYVAVVGWPSEEPETDLVLHSVKSLHELPGKRVRVYPREVQPYVVADRIEEIES